MATITFDGPNKYITIGYDGDVTNVTAAEMYSRWKEWVQAGNAQWEPAFGETVGGNPLGGGTSLSGYYFIRNDLGWKLLHESYNYQINVIGDLYPTDPNISFLDTTPDMYSVTFVFQRSAASYVTVGSGQDPATIAAAVWDEDMSAHSTPNSFGKRLREIFPTLWGVK